MTKDQQDAVIAEMVRDRRDLRTNVICMQEILEKAAEALEIGIGIAERAARGLENAQTGRFADMKYPTASELREIVANLDASREGNYIPKYTGTRLQPAQMHLWKRSLNRSKSEP